MTEEYNGIEGEEDAKFARIHSIDQNPSPSAFDTEEEANNFTPPEWFGEDVTFLPIYHNSYLSRV